jgi:transposase
MELEVGRGATGFTCEFKLEAVKLIKECGVGYVQAARDLGVHQSVLRNWVRASKRPWQMKPEQLEIAQLKRGDERAEGGAGHPKKNARRCLSSCGHRNWLRYVLSAPAGSGRWLFGGINPVKDLVHGLLRTSEW